MKLIPLPLAGAVALALGLTPALVQAQWSSSSGYTQTRHPVVLVHGMLGFDAIGPIDYFYEIPDALRAGGATVFTPAVSALNSSEARGEQLLRTLQTLQSRYGYTKFNLIGHSHGGQTARYVAAVAPHLVASVTSIGTPHAGTPVADAVERGASITGTTGSLTSVFNLMGNFISWLSGSALPQNSLGTLTSLTTSGTARFNARYPQGAPTSRCGSGPSQVNGIAYYSMGGTRPKTNVYDVGDPLLAATSLFINEPNDGVVGRCSSHWGTVLRDNYDWNHMDEINQTFGLIGYFASEPSTVYRSHVNRLKGKGL